MSDHPNAAVVRGAYHAIAKGDLPGVLAAFAEDAVIHVSAEGPMGGDHKGREAIGKLLGDLVAWTGGTIKLEVSEVFADDAHAVAVIHETGTRSRDGQTLDVHEIHLLRVSDGLATELWDIPGGADREVHDQFFSA